jgi:hypothetical protein
MLVLAGPLLLVAEHPAAPAVACQLLLLLLLLRCLGALLHTAWQEV